MAISIELTHEIKKKLDKIARDTERTRSQIIRLAIKNLIKEHGGRNGKRD